MFPHNESTCHVQEVSRTSTKHASHIHDVFVVEMIGGCSTTNPVTVQLLLAITEPSESMQHGMTLRPNKL